MKENKEKATGKKDIWHLRSVSLEAINAANLIAKKEKRRTGEWVSDIILKAAQERLGKKTEVAKPEDAIKDFLKDFMKQLEERNERIEKQLQILSEPWYKMLFWRKNKWDAMAMGVYEKEEE